MKIKPTEDLEKEIARELREDDPLVIGDIIISAELEAFGINKDNEGNMINLYRLSNVKKDQ